MLSRRRETKEELSVKTPVEYHLKWVLVLWWPQGGPSGVRRELRPTKEALSSVMAAGLLSGCPNHPVTYPAPPAASHRRQEEKGETMEPTENKTRESKMRAAGGNADVL